MTATHTRTVTALTIALAASTILTANATPVRRGVYVGASTGASFVTAQRYNKIENGVPPTIFRNEASARGYNGSIFAGWNFYCDCRFILGLEVSGDAYSNRGHFTQHLITPASRTHFQESFDIDYSVNATLHPGWKVNDCTVFYGIIGYSHAELNVELRNLIPETAGGNPITYEDCEDMHGFVIGAGLERQLFCHFGVFASYQYTYYGQECFPDGVEGNLQENPRFIKERSLTLDTNVFKMGVIIPF